MKRKTVTPNVTRGIVKSIENNTLCKCDMVDTELFPLSKFSRHSIICPIHIRYLEKIKKG
jgi:hypothetical protein